MNAETMDLRVKRLRIRAWRRGTKEMDLILGGWFNRNLAYLQETDLTSFEALLDEEDHDIYQWVTGVSEAPEQLDPLVKKISLSISSGSAIPGT